MTQDNFPVIEAFDSPVDHVKKDPLSSQMLPLLEYDTGNLTGTRLAVNTGVSYNSESQRFEVHFPSKPSEKIRTALKSMSFGWNRFESCWELYTWQVRLYDRDEIGDFLSAMKRGVLIEPLALPKGAKRAWWKDVDSSAKSLIEQLAKETDAKRNSEGFGRLLKAAKLFHKYSKNNVFSILVQCPEATQVTGERAWNKLGRYVKWGEQPIVILGPRFKTEEEYNKDTGRWEKKKKMAGFLALPVYDISQTAGDDLPTIQMPDMSGDDGLLFLEAMKDFCKEHKIKANFLDLKGLGILGESKGGEIDVSNSVSVNAQVSTIIHEVAHEYLHSSKKGIKDSSKRIRETEAEGVAFVVLSHLGLPTEAPVYIALQGGTGKTIIDCAENIARVSHVIISYLMEKTRWEIESFDSAKAYTG